MAKTCIDMDMFTAYFGQYISKEDRKRVENHLANCNECLKLFAMTAETLLDSEIYEYDPICETKANDLWKTLKHKIDRFIQWSKNQFPPQWTLHANALYQLIPVMVRTEEHTTESETNKSITSQKSPIDFVHMEKNFDQLKVELYFEHISEDKITLKVRVYADSTKVLDDIFVYLDRKDTGFTAKPLIKEYVVFENLPYDTYVIKLEQDNHLKGNVELKINQNGIYLIH